MSKKLSQAEIRAAQNLRRIYNNKKGRMALTQVKIASILGISQVAVSNYMSGTISLNLEIVLRFAALLEVQVDEIYPELAKEFGLSKVTKNDVVVIGSMNGGYITPYKITVEGVAMPHNLAVEVIDSTQAPHLPKGSLVIIDPLATLQESDKVLVKFTDDQRWFVLQIVAMKQMQLTMKQAFAEKDTPYTPKKDTKFNISEFSHIFKITTIQFGGK